MPHTFLRRASSAAAVLALVCFGGGAARADADRPSARTAPAAAGLQPLTAPFPASTAAPGESALRRREDGTFAAVARSSGRVRSFDLTARDAPWTLRAGLTVMARTYNGVVPGPTLVVRQGDDVRLHFRNAMNVPDTIHLHGIHGIPVTMDGVAGISQPLVPPGGSFEYAFRATEPGTFIYHSHDNEEMVNSGLYGAIVVLPARPRADETADRDDVEMLSSWSIQDTAENHFTINGKEYPDTTPIEVRHGQRVRLRWINMSGENLHTMHTHGHDMRVIARDAHPVETRDIEDTIGLAPGQRADVVVTANAAPGNWLVHCHVLDHVEDADSMPAGLVTTIHYAGVPNRLAAMNDEMRAHMPPGKGRAPARMSFGTTALLGLFAGLTIFLGLPVARARGLAPATIAVLNAAALGILLYLIVEIAGNATTPLIDAVTAWKFGAAGAAAAGTALALAGSYIAGLLVGLVGLGTVAARMMKNAASHGGDVRPLRLAAIIAVGIGAHNFAEGLAIGSSAAAGSTALALGLIVGFALHNTTEGFGIAAPLAGHGVVATWRQIFIAGAIAGGPTFAGAMIGYRFVSPALSTFFLTVAVGALIFVVGELWSVVKRLGLTVGATTALAGGFVVALATEIVIDLNGG